MGAEFLSSLNSAARAAIPFINQGVGLGLSANSILRSLTSSGLGIRASTGRSLVRMARSSLAAGKLQQSLQGNVLPNITDFTAAEYYTAKRFTYTIRHNVIYDDTGAAGVEFMNISSDSLLTNDQLSESVDSIMALSAAEYSFTIQSSSIQGVLVDPRFLP